MLSPAFEDYDYGKTHCLLYPSVIMTQTTIDPSIAIDIWGLSNLW